MKEVNPKSPLTLNNKVRKKSNFSVDNICSGYSSLNIEVERFFDKQDICLYECIVSGYRFYYPFSIIGDAEFYEDLSKNRVNYYSERWEHRRALNFIRKNDSVLEIGSGFGLFLKMLESKGIKSKGLELNPHAVYKCNQEGLNVEQKLVQDIAKTHKNKFDVVCFFQVLEHITEVNDFLKSAIDTLKVGGKLIIGVPNNNPYLFKYDKYHTLNLPPHHAGLWNEKALKALEKLFPLKLESTLFEPLNENYDSYLKIQLEASKNLIQKSFIKFFKKNFPKLLKKIICKYCHGRNIFVVYSKL